MLIFCMCTVLSVVITIEMSYSFLQGFQTGQLVEYIMLNLLKVLQHQEQSITKSGRVHNPCRKNYSAP